MNVPLTLNLPVIRGNQAEHEDALLHPLLICRILHIMASNKMFRNSIGSKGTYTRKSHKGKEAEYIYERLLGIQDFK